MEPSRQRVDLAQAEDRRAWRLFWGSFVLTVLILTHLFYLAGKSGSLLTVIETFLPAVLLWSMVMTGYSFHVVHKLAEQRGQQIGPSFTDNATGVFTLDYLESCLEHERRRVEDGQGGSTAVAYVDLVRLADVNRAFGHAVGDIVLKATAQLMASSIRPGDVIGRVGGDEFLIVMPDTSQEEGGDAIDVVKTAIRGYRLNMGKRGRVDFLECNVGLAAFPDEGRTPEEVIAAARRKLPDLRSTIRQSSSLAAPTERG